jgi:ribonuclease Z
MTHFSPRYAPGNDLQLSDLLAEAQAIFPQTIMASDLMIHEIPRQSEKTLVSSAW